MKWLIYTRTLTSNMHLTQVEVFHSYNFKKITNKISPLFANILIATFSSLIALQI